MRLRVDDGRRQLIDVSSNASSGVEVDQVPIVVCCIDDGTSRVIATRLVDAEEIAVVVVVLAADCSASNVAVYVLRVDVVLDRRVEVVREIWHVVRGPGSTNCAV